jgi:hypothetical protein
MFNTIEHQIALGRIEKYLTSRGYSVKYDSNSYYIDTEQDTIHAPKQYIHTEKLLCALLHEAGHTQCPDSELLTIYRHSKSDQALVIEQEYQAWSIGLDIARELNIATPAFTRVYKSEWIKHWTSYINIGMDPAFKIMAEPYRVKSRVIDLG